MPSNHEADTFSQLLASLAMNSEAAPAEPGETGENPPDAEDALVPADGDGEPPDSSAFFMHPAMLPAPHARTQLSLTTPPMSGGGDGAVEAPAAPQPASSGQAPSPAAGAAPEVLSPTLTPEKPSGTAGAVQAPGAALSPSSSGMAPGFPDSELEPNREGQPQALTFALRLTRQGSADNSAPAQTGPRTQTPAEGIQPVEPDAKTTQPENPEPGAQPEPPPRQAPPQGMPATLENPSGRGLPSAARPEVAARPGQPDAPAPPPAPPKEPAVRDLSLLVPGVKHAGGGRDDIAVRLVERGGEVYVAVHTPDRETTAALRGDLGRLAARFEEHGYQAEAWHPAEGGGEVAGSQRAAREEASRQPSDWDGGSQQHPPSHGHKRRQPGQPGWLKQLADQQKGENI